MTQSTSAVRAALLAGCETLFADETDTNGAPVLVCLGEPGSYQPDYIVAVAMATRQPVTRPTMGTSRSRERMAEVDVVFSTYVAGDEAASVSAADACESLVDAFETWIRTKPNEALGGACTDAWVSNIDGPRIQAARAIEGSGVTGRVAESVVTITTRIRY